MSSSKKSRKRKPSKKERDVFREAAEEVLKKAEEERKSQLYSVGYRFALYDPVNPDEPLKDCNIAHDRSWITFSAAEMKTYRERVQFANEMLIAAGAQYLVGIFPAALTGFATINDGTVRKYYRDDDDDDEGEEWKKAKGGAA